MPEPRWWHGIHDWLLWQWYHPPYMKIIKKIIKIIRNHGRP